jgi:hypothetical protein
MAIQADPSLRTIGFRIESGLDTTGLSTISRSGGGASRDEITGLLRASITSNAKMTFPLVLSASGAVVSGNWETTWNPTETDPEATPAYVPNACVTLEKWKQAGTDSVTVPLELLEKITTQASGISPDGRKTAIGTTDNHLIVSDIVTGQSVVVMTAENHIEPAGWTSDSKRVVFVEANPNNYIIKTVNIESGSVHSLIDTQQSYIWFASVSPDHEWIAYSEKVPGRMAPGIFMVRLDGSEKRLLVQLDYWMSSVASWGQDGNWLVFNLTDMDRSGSPTTQAALNVETCQFFPLP